MQIRTLFSRVNLHRFLIHLPGFKVRHHIILLGLPFILAFLAVGSLVVMLLWNALLPAIFGLKSISFLQAAGLLVLSKILFGGFRHRPRPFYGPKRHWAQWKNWREGEASKQGGEPEKE